MALTATASPPVREEIIERLNLRDPRVIAQGFDLTTSGWRSSDTSRTTSGRRWSNASRT